MNIKRTWVVASATLAVAGFTGAGVALASDDVPLHDQRQVPAVHLEGEAAGDDSAASANSADSPSGPDGRAPANLAPPPAPAPADSGNSPAPAPAPRADHSADSPNSTDSGD